MIDGFIAGLMAVVALMAFFFGRKTQKNKEAKKKAENTIDEQKKALKSFKKSIDRKYKDDTFKKRLNDADSADDLSRLRNQAARERKD